MEPSPTSPPRRPWSATRTAFRILIAIEVIALGAVFTVGMIDRPSSEDPTPPPPTTTPEGAAAEVLTATFTPVCSGTGVPVAGERGPAGTRRRAFYLAPATGGTSPELNAGRATTADAFDTIVCATAVTGEGVVCNYYSTPFAQGTPIASYTSFSLDVQVSAHDARSGLEFGSRKIHLGPDPCRAQISSSKAEDVFAELDWEQVAWQIAPLLDI